MRTRRTTSILCTVGCTAAFVWFSGSGHAGAADKTETDNAETDNAKIEAYEVVTNLDNPSGVAVHPQTGHVFIASRLGVYRYVSQTHTPHLEIIGYPTDVYGKGPKYNIGPLGIAFLSNDQLVVGDGSRKDGDELVRVYKIDAEPPKQPQKESAATLTLGPIKAKEGVTIKGEGNFYGVAVGAGAIFVSCNGDDTKGWIAKSEIKDGKPGPLTPSIATKVATEVDAPVPLIFSLDGKELVVGQMGEMNVAGDSLLTTYDPKTGMLKKKWKTGLSDIAGLAYSPKTKKLYAVDFSWVDATKGGLFRLDIENDAVKATKIIGLDKPTALAFDEKGKLWITVFGTAKKDDPKDKSPGKLLAIEPGL